MSDCKGDYDRDCDYDCDCDCNCDCDVTVIVIVTEIICTYIMKFMQKSEGV